jgi:hypothetical protein
LTLLVALDESGKSVHKIWPWHVWIK